MYILYMKNYNKQIIIGAFLFVIWVLVFQLFNNGKNIIEGHGGGGGGGRGGGGGFGRGGGGYYGNNNYYGVGDASYINPAYGCDEDNDSDICRGRYYGIFY